MHISKLAQDSLHEIKQLRTILTRLLANVSSTVDENNDGNENNSQDQEAGVKQTPKANPAQNYISAPSESRTMVDSPDAPNYRLQKGKTNLSDNLQSHRLIARIRDCFETLDELARYMRASRVRNCIGDLGLHNALSLITTVDQLEFSEPPMGDCSREEADTIPARRSDWFVDRWDAERWKNRYCERAHTILEGLLACSMFQRSHLSSEQKRREREAVVSGGREVRPDLENLLNEIQGLLPMLTITLTASVSNISLVHIKVAETMQCLVTFRRLHPAWIIVRGITEDCLIHQGYDATNTQMSQSMDAEPMSKPLEALVNFKSLQSTASNDILISLLCSGSKTGKNDQEPRSRKTTNPTYTSRSIQLSNLSINQFDFVTPSRYPLFQKITALAQSVLLHMSNDYQPASTVRSLFSWLHSYHDLYTAPCVRCNNLLGQDVSLPLWRSYSQSRKPGQRSVEPLHEYCQPIP